VPFPDFPPTDDSSPPENFRTGMLLLLLSPPLIMVEVGLDELAMVAAIVHR